jgi:hypothetical protein
MLDEDPEGGTLEEALDLAESRISWNMRVSCPAKVLKWDAAKCMVNVQPLLKTYYFDDESEDQVTVDEPVICNVPVVFPWGMLADIPVGHTVLLVFCDRSLDSWLVNGGMVNPDDERSHDLNDAIAFPGLFDFGHPRKAADYEAATLSGVLTDFLTNTLIPWVKTGVAPTGGGTVTYATNPTIPTLGSSVMKVKK